MCKTAYIKVPNKSWLAQLVEQPFYKRGGCKFEPQLLAWSLLDLNIWLFCYSFLFTVLEFCLASKFLNRVNSSIVIWAAT